MIFLVYPASEIPVRDKATRWDATDYSNDSQRLTVQGGSQSGFQQEELFSLSALVSPDAPEPLFQFLPTRLFFSEAFLNTPDFLLFGHYFALLAMRNLFPADEL